MSQIPIQISVILPVYNAGDTLEAAIQSLLEQTEEKFELIIVDDGSEDNSPSIINRYSQKDDRLRPVITDHHGIVAALNVGLEKARGDYITRMDADDISLPRRLELQKQFLDNHPDVGLVSSLVEHFGNKEKHAGYARYVNWINSLTDHAAISINRFIESPLAHPSVMFRRKMVEQYGGYREGDFPEDYELWLRWLDHGVRLEKIPQVLLKWRDQPGRLSRSSSRYSAEAFYRVKARYLSRWLEEHNPNHPEVTIWGAGRVTRKRAEMLTSHGIAITRYIDVDPKKIGNTVQGRPVIGPDEIRASDTNFIISYVGTRGTNKKIRKALRSKGKREGTDFIFAA